MYKQLYQFYTQNHRYRFVSVKIPAACGERRLNRCPMLPSSVFVKTWPCSFFWKQGKQRQLKAPKFWNSYWYALLNRCIYDTWTIFPGTKQLNLFSHNGSLHPCSWLAKLWPPTLEAPSLNPNWATKCPPEPLSTAPIWPRFCCHVLSSGKDSLIWMPCLLLQLWDEVQRSQKAFWWVFFFF